MQTARWAMPAATAEKGPLTVEHQADTFIDFVRDSRALSAGAAGLGFTPLPQGYRI